MDQLHRHHRQQLSALLDGELATDQARFMRRRLEHDPDLIQCLERWQMVADILRGTPIVPAGADFATQLQQRLATEPAPIAVEQRSPWVVRAQTWARGGALVLGGVVLGHLGAITDRLKHDWVARTTAPATAKIIALDTSGPPVATASQPLLQTAPRQRGQAAVLPGKRQTPVFSYSPLAQAIREVPARPWPHSTAAMSAWFGAGYVTESASADPFAPPDPSAAVDSVVP